MNPLATLLGEWFRLDPRGWENFESVLCAGLRRANCYQLISWVMGGDVPILTLDTERVARRVVLDALEQHVYDNHDELSSVLESSQQRLRKLRNCAAEAAREVVPTVPWSGDDWYELPPLIRKLLTYMANRERADLEVVFPAVWEKKYEAGRNDVTVAMSRANTFLAKHQWPRTLHKGRSESVIYWD